ncbi:hypothetical protein [Methylosinus sp. Sm6]|uniref:hypothetical protein n=1 Tax=Methylosinus sp. Sm6 TaxID=2866948 RepID=UPI001C99CCD8|nr:hypothetical protein [Methylosinus sp. Sm6]MBY6242869.1 hypothetical protein [Methylosinus sp. Sm6]
MKYHAIMSAAAALGVALSLTLPADAGERDGRGGHGIGAGQTRMRGNFSGSRSAHEARHGQFGSGRTFVGRSVSAPHGGLFQDYSHRPNHAAYDRGFLPGGIFFPLAVIAAGLSAPFNGNYGFGGDQTGGYMIAPAAAEYAYGNYCATDVKTCLLYEPAATGVNCSCRVAGGRAYGSVIQ